jgi:hypothetical protein
MMYARIIALSLVAFPAMAESSPAPTVSWFLAHPAALHDQMRSCANDPGTAKHVPACENAYQANLSRAAQEAQARADEAYYAQVGARQASLHALTGKLQFCNALADPVDRRIQGCAAAYAQAETLRATQ